MVVLFFFSFELLQFPFLWPRPQLCVPVPVPTAPHWSLLRNHLSGLLSATRTHTQLKVGGQLHHSLFVLATSPPLADSWTSQAPGENGDGRARARPRTPYCRSGWHWDSWWRGSPVAQGPVLTRCPKGEQGVRKGLWCPGGGAQQSGGRQQPGILSHQRLTDGERSFTEAHRSRPLQTAKMARLGSV